MNDAFVNSESSDGIGRVLFFHPKANSLPGALLKQLAEAVVKLGDDSSVRVVLIESAGEGSFCAGASFDEFKNIASEAEGEAFFLGFAQVILAIRAVPKFVITRVQGKAVGGALGIIAASDYAIACEGASVKLSEFDLGIGPFTIGPAVERKMGTAAFSAMSIDTQWRDAHWAGSKGLYAQVHSSQSELDEQLGQFLRTLCEASPAATRQMKLMFWENTEHWPELLHRRASISGRLLVSHREAKKN